MLPRYNTVAEKYHIITSNVTTPYRVVFTNLAETAPLILEIPAGPRALVFRYHILKTPCRVVGPFAL